MMGGFQFRALHHEMVTSGQMTNRELHDVVLQGGSMPVEMVRVRVKKESIPRGYTTSWKFEGELEN